MVQERFQLLNKLGERPILEPSCLYASFEEIKDLAGELTVDLFFLLARMLPVIMQHPAFIGIIYLCQ